MAAHRRRRGGEIAAFQELFDRYYAPLCRFAEFWIRDSTSAEEVVLDVYTHVWQHAAKLRVTGSVRAYLFRAVRNRSLNHIRDNRFSYVFIFFIVIAGGEGKHAQTQQQHSCHE